MESFKNFTGKTVEEALQQACIELGTSSDNIEYNIIERETKGFLGIGAKKAVIEARRKKTEEEEDIISEVFREKKPEKTESKKKNPEKKQEKSEKKAEKKEDKAEKKQDKKDDKAKKKDESGAKAAAKETENSGEKADRKKKEVKEKAAREEKSEKDEKTEKALKVKPEKSDKPQKSERSENAEKPEKADKPEKKEKPERVREKADPAVATARAEQFLSSVFDAMDMKVDINTSFEDDTLSIDLAGDDMGVLIGKRGQTLDSIQYLTSLVVNKGKASYVRVKVDTEDYRERRKATLENLAKNIAFKVKKTRKPVYLEPMNPYERRIIHSALQNDPYVTTHSEGEEPLRRVVVTLKKKDVSKSEEEEF